MGEFVCPVQGCSGKFHSDAPASAPSWDDVEVGDTIVYERRGVVKYRHEERPTGMLEDSRSFSIDLDTLKYVEKPVRTFKPGDVVRDKGDSGLLYTVADGRVFSHGRRQWFNDDKPFTTKYYELVEG